MKENFNKIYKLFFMTIVFLTISSFVNFNEKHSNTTNPNEYPFIEKIKGCWSSTTNPVTLCFVNYNTDKYYFQIKTFEAPEGSVSNSYYYDHVSDNHIYFVPEASNEQFVVYKFIFTTGQNVYETAYIRLNKAIPGMLELGKFNESGAFQRHSKLIPTSNFKDIIVNNVQDALNLFLGKWTAQDFDTPVNYFHSHKQQAVFTFVNTGTADEPFYKMRFFDIDKHGSLVSQKQSADVIFNDKGTKIVDDQGWTSFTSAAAKQYVDPESGEIKKVLFVNFQDYFCNGRFAVVYPDNN